MAPSRPEIFGNKAGLAAVFRLARVEARLPVIVVQADCCLPGKLVDLPLKLSKPSIDENKTNPGDHRGSQIENQSRYDYQEKFNMNLAAP